jgi:hypothetical protein
MREFRPYGLGLCCYNSCHGNAVQQLVSIPERLLLVKVCAYCLQGPT